VEWLRNSILVTPCAYLLAVLVLSLVLPRVEGSSDLLNMRIDNDTARTVLSSVAGGMIAFTGLVVSIAVVVVQFAAGQYSPRLVARFRRDPVFKHSLGIFIAPALFSLIALRNIGRAGDTIAPSLTIGVDFILLGIAILAFFILVGRLLDLLRPRKLVERLVKAGAHAATEVYPFRAGHAPPIEDQHELDDAITLSFHGRHAVLVALDRGRLVRAATKSNVVIELTVGVGSYLPREAPIFKIYRNQDSKAVDESELQRSVLVGGGRTITQDPAFAIRAMVDIAVRALSPAVNDPTTAVEVIDGLETFILALAWRDLERGRLADTNGNVRLLFPNPAWEELLDLAVTEIRRFGVGSPQVARRLRALFDDLLNHTPASRKPAIKAQIARYEAAVARAVPDPIERAYSMTADRLGIGTAAP